MKRLLAVSLLATATAASMHAQAFKFDTPSDWDIRWDNTVKGNLMMRVQDQDPSVYDPNRAVPRAAAQLSDDADYSVSQGHMVSERADILSEMDVIWRDKLGFRVSGAGWYDFAYDGNSNYPSSGSTKSFSSVYDTWGMLTVQPGEYNDAAKDLSYRGGELLDAFVFANFEVGDASANVRIGRHTLYWGQSLLSIGAIHGFAGSMAALDLAKGLGTPGSEAKELFIPNNKISSTVQFSDKITISAFYALGFEPLRWPAGGTYFSLNEALTQNSECLTAFAGDGPATPRTCLRSVDYKSNDSGDWGVNLKYYIEPLDLDVAFIYMNNTDRVTSGLYSTFFDNTPAEVNQAKETNATLLGHYGWVYKSDIDTFGISLAKEYWDISWGADLVYRNNNALNPDLSATLAAPSPGLSSVDPDGNYPGPTGDTVHVVLNGLGFLDGDWGLWDGGTYLAELTLSNLLHFGQFEEKANPFIEEDHWNSNISGVFKPTWYQVRPGWDLSVLASINYTLKGKQAPNSAGGNERVGNGSIGMSVDIDQIWNVALNYNIYYGPQKNGTAAYIKDRDNLALTVKRTF
ncbi:MAG: DUF1302 family protein [Halioglobus sp.]